MTIIKLSIFLSILENLCQHSPESLLTFPGIFSNIPRNLFEHSPESLRTFPGIFFNIPRNVKIITFPGILWEIPRNPSEQSPRSPHSPHSAPRSCIPGFINSLLKAKNFVQWNTSSKETVSRVISSIVNCVIKKTLFVKMKNVYCSEL